MKILVVGGGGREHALAWKLAGEPGVSQVVCAPGNPGIARVARCLPADTSKPGELALLLIRLFRGLDAFMGGHEENQRLWLAAPNVAFGSPPLIAIRRVEGLAYAVQYIDAMRGR